MRIKGKGCPTYKISEKMASYDQLKKLDRKVLILGAVKIQNKLSSQPMSSPTLRLHLQHMRRTKSRRQIEQYRSYIRELAAVGSPQQQGVRDSQARSRLCAGPQLPIQTKTSRAFQGGESGGDRRLTQALIAHAEKCNH